MSLQKLVETYLRIPLNGTEIHRLTGKPPILYEDLAKFKRFEDVIGKEGYQVVLMQVSTKTDGHFVALGINVVGNPYFFDPYGMSFIQVQQLSSYDKKLPDFITPLLEDYAQRNNKQVERNKTDFQSKAGGVADCGRHSSLACLLLRHLTFRELEELYFTNNDTWLKGDHVATILTLLTLDDIGKYYINRGK
jgi:hypothetical protein